MTEKRLGGWAFPVIHETYPDCNGMSLRDWFAGQFMALMCNNIVSSMDEVINALGSGS